MSETIRLPQFMRDAELRAASFDEPANSIEVIWTAGATVRRRSWADGPFDEELVVGEKTVRLDRLNGGAPFLNSHDNYDLRSVLGSVMPGTAVLKGGKGYAKIQMTRREDAAGIVQDIRDGVIRNISVGYKIHAIEKTERKNQVPLFRILDWEPLEISAVAIGFDPAAQVRGGENAEMHECHVVRGDPDLNAVRRIRMMQQQRQAGIGR
jgi:phage head maturation protease